MRRLPSALIDRIAAGEVVERPASVVKELLENALDAGAGRIRVELRDGGKALIAVADDGCGMSPQDARLALERHATSKLGDGDDLERIASYGFRGEALPAIAAVSKLTLTTRPRGAPAGFELRVEADSGTEGGSRTVEREVGAPVGTRVEVAELFGNVPARRKFLKSATTEWGHASDWVSRSALARPDVHFDMSRDGREAFSWPAAREPFDRVAAVLGEREAEALLPVEAQEGRVRVWGWISRPDRHRGNLAGVYWFVNGRPVRDRLLRHALVECYRDVLPRGRFPSAVLHLDLPLEAVDVNVHPAKWEVRFADGGAAHRWVRAAVRSGLESRRWLGAAPGEAGSGAAAPGPAYAGARRSEPAAASVREAPPAGDDWLFASGPSAERLAADPAGPADEPLRFGELRLLGQVLATYLVVEAKDGVLLQDQHAAHERVLYERLRAGWLERGVERQGLLAPLAVQLEPRAFAALCEAGPELARLGFEVEAFGEDTLAVRAVPALLADCDPAALLRSLGEAWLEGESALRGAQRARQLEAADRCFATLACHSARRKGEVLDEREQRALLEALDTIPWAPTCPHGRPVAVPWSVAEIERRFARR